MTQNTRRFESRWRSVTFLSFSHLQANSKDTIVRLCNEAFLQRNETSLSGEVCSRVGELLSLEQNESRKVCNCIVS